jgi:hypothetical protein
MSDELKEELEVAFTATWTEQLIEQAGKDRSFLGKPIFYTATGDIDAKGLSNQLRVSESLVSESFQNWLSAGNKPPGAPATRHDSPAPEYNPPVFAQFTPEPIANDQNTISSATQSLNEMTAYNQAKMNHQHTAAMMAPPQHQMPTGGDTSSQMLQMLLPHLLGGNKGGGDDSLVMLKLLESQNMQAERSRQDQAMMMNAMNTNSTQMMALLIDSMKNGGGRSSTDDVLVQFALEEMRGGRNSSPEESVFDSLVKSGQLADITGSIASSLKSVMAARSPPVGAVPNYNIQAQPEPQIQEYPMQQQYQVEQQQPVYHEQQPVYQEQQPIEASFEDKCKHVMGQIHDSLPKEWKANADFIEILRRATERAVTRAEDFHPMSVEHQIQRSIKELLVVINLRLIGTSVKQIRDGAVSTTMAASVLKDHPLYPIFQVETYDSLIEMMVAYIDCDVPGVKNIAYDIEFLAEQGNRQVIEEVLNTAKQG